MSNESIDGDSARLPSVLYSLHVAMDTGWGELEQGKGNKKTHAVLCVWYKDDRLAKFVSSMVATWSLVLSCRYENAEKPSLPPLPVLETLVGFDPIYENLETPNGVVWEALQNRKQIIEGEVKVLKLAAREAAKARMATLAAWS